jgi:nucleoside-diphosphate-sugar epimerase
LSRPERILVTGAAGFIGSTLTERLLGEGRLVIGLDSFDPFYPESAKQENLQTALGSDGFSLVRADIRDSERMRRVFAEHRPDAVVHLAALAGVRELGVPAEIDSQPEQTGDVRRTWGDIEEARRRLGYEPKVTFEDGLGRFASWLRGQS